ncbi:hypothetical protein [Streptomyces sp. Midd1]|uniref:hypothetical protein n=1 Tax=Streptomyces sp. Midd3 TaxID=3161191 RepID=UPI0034DB1473
MTSKRRTRGPRIVCLLLALHAVWSAWCACQQYLYGNTLCAGLFFLFSLVPLAGLVSLNELADLHDALRHYRARDAHAATPTPKLAPTVPEKAEVL